MKVRKLSAYGAPISIVAASILLSPALALAADSNVEQVLDNRAVSSDVDDASSDKPELNPVEDKKIEPDARESGTFEDDTQPYSEGEELEQNR
jgi:hypothetical protein